MMPASNHTGKRFGRLLVVQRAVSHSGRANWTCLCDCGAAVNVLATYLVRGAVKSCGCLKTDTVHGSARRGKKTNEYHIWVSLRQRCTNPKNKKYRDYGGRGIGVCPRWTESFDNFIADMGERPSPLHSLDRYPDNDGNYEPGNCRWATWDEQANNRRPRRTAKQIEAAT